MGQGTSDKILGVIWIPVWIIWIHFGGGLHSPSALVYVYFTFRKDHLCLQVTEISLQTTLRFTAMLLWMMQNYFQHLKKCLSEMQLWMNSNKLKLNRSNTEFIVFGVADM